MTTASANLFDQQESNRRRSFWLVTGFLLFFAWIGFGGDLAIYLATAGTPQAHRVPGIGIVVTLVAGGICWYSWKKGPARVLWATGAAEVLEPADDLERRLVNVVEEMAIASGLPKPRVFVVPDADPNAFATGIEPGQASVAVTRGLLERLDRDELQGVVAHEMAHVRNLDTRLMTLLAAMVGAIALMSDGLGRMRFLLFGLISCGRQSFVDIGDDLPIAFVEVEGLFRGGPSGRVFERFDALQNVLDCRQIAGGGLGEQLLHAGAHDRHRLARAVDADGDLLVRLAQEVGREVLCVLRSLRPPLRITGLALLEPRVSRRHQRPLLRSAAAGRSTPRCLAICANVFPFA